MCSRNKERKTECTFCAGLELSVVWQQVWDFDWSLVEENSDTWVLQRLGATAAYERLRAQV